MTRRELVAAMVATPLAVAAAAELAQHTQKEAPPMRNAMSTSAGGTATAPAAPSAPAATALLVLYSSRSGHTRRIAEFLADRSRQAGHAAAVEEIGACAARPATSFPPVVVIAASVQVGRYEDAVTSFVAGRRPELESVHSAFLSVCLSQAQPAKHAEAQGYIDSLLAETGWRPTATLSAAGALSYTQYGFLKRAMMKQVARQGGLPTDTRRDHEFTDWPEVAAFGDALLARLPAS